MIDKLTKEQEEKIPVYLKKWLDNGYSTQPLDREKTAESIKWIYEFSRMESHYMWFCDSPMQIQLIIHLLKSEGLLKYNINYNITGNLADNLRKNLPDNLGDNLWENLRDNIRYNLLDTIWDNLGETLMTNLRNKLWDTLVNNIRDNLWDTLRENTRDKLWDNIRANIWDNLKGNLKANLWANLNETLKNSKIDFNYFFSPSLESYWVGTYDFILNELLPERKDEFSVFNTKCIGFYKNTFLIIPFNGICFISERPTLIKTIKSTNDRRVLHCDGGPCMTFKDGYEFHALNGIRVSKEIAETPSHLLDSNIVLKENNADVRREIVRKIGTEKLCNDLNAKCIDKSPDGMYELLMLDLKDGRMRPYLKMINPSIGVYHIEGVHPDCTTVESALMFRNGTSQKPIKLT